MARAFSSTGALVLFLTTATWFATPTAAARRLGAAHAPFLFQLCWQTGQDYDVGMRMRVVLSFVSPPPPSWANASQVLQQDSRHLVTVLPCSACPEPRGCACLHAIVDARQSWYVSVYPTYICSTPTLSVAPPVRSQRSTRGTSAAA